MSDGTSLEFYIGPRGTAHGRPRVRVFASSQDAGRAVAHQIVDLIRAKAQRGETAVLGLATGSTPQGVYEELVRLHREERLSFRNVVTFNLDEYWPMDPAALQSYRRFMNECLFDHIDIDLQNTHVPDGSLPQPEVGTFCYEYERMIRDAGGIDFQILGIGRTGHIGFNEPGSARDSRTRLITLDRVTRLDAASDFFGEPNVPRQAITMGVGTILEARRIALLAFGEGKSRIIRQAVEGQVGQSVAASFLQEHPSVDFILDRAAAAELTPVQTPWLLGPLAQRGEEWDDSMTRRAVIWLARTLNKPILKLVTEDYNEHGLQELLSARGPAYDLNIEVFKSLQNTITGWPAGKPGRPHGDRSDCRDAALKNALGTIEPVAPSRSVFPKRIVVFSPHPDDDVISMGGTLIRLCQHRHEVHVAYQTSGNIAVFDEKAVRHADFVADFTRAFGLFAEGEARRIEQQIMSFVAAKKPAEIDSAALQKIKTLIRRSEARAAARYCGVLSDRIHFLDMPFYETGRVRKRPLGDRDVQLIVNLLDRIRPHQVYAAGDLSDPHGTHRVCLAAITAAIAQLGEHAWMRECETWLYRGAWQEWEPQQIEMAVPLSPDEVDRKRMAIFHHESQKDKALFPGPQDSREFWQRAEDRNRHTAELYDKLGLPEYQAIEAFVRWRPGMA